MLDNALGIGWVRYVPKTVKMLALEGLSLGLELACWPRVGNGWAVYSGSGIGQPLPTLGNWPTLDPCPQLAHTWMVDCFVVRSVNSKLWPESVQ